MKIKFLGTSYGAPSKGRRQQSILIETINKNAYLFDAGAPVTDVLINESYDISRIRGVFISHLHGDHMNGLHDLINLAEFLNARFPVYLSEQRGVDAFEAYTFMQLGDRKSGRVDFRLFSEGRFYDDGTLKVTAVPNAHMEKSCKPSYGFLIEADGSAIYITGDLHPSLKDMPLLLDEIHTDMIVTECAHFSPEELLDRLESCKTDRVAFVHVMPPEKYADLERLAIGREFIPLYPRDNDEYEILEMKTSADAK